MIQDTFGDHFLHFDPWLSYVLTVIWIISITNAVNLIDGLDGFWSVGFDYFMVTMGIVSHFFLPVPNLFLTMTFSCSHGPFAGFLLLSSEFLYLGGYRALFIGFMISVLSFAGLKNAEQLCGLLRRWLSWGWVRMQRSSVVGLSLVQKFRSRNPHHHLTLFGATSRRLRF